MKKIIILIVFGFELVSAQTGIGTTTPHASAKLHVSATDKAFLPPRVTLLSVTDATTIPNPAVGLLVYNLGSVGLQAGYYYWNNANWATIATASSPDQTVDYVSVTLSSNQTVETGSVVLFNSNIGGNIPYNTSTGMFSLIAGKTYRLTGVIAISSANTTQKEVNVAWRTAAGDLIGGRGEALSSNFTTTAFGSGIADVIYTPTVNTTISLTVNYGSGTVILWQNFTYANIQQIGSSATVNPWTLSGTNTYTTTGNVGIGTATPTTKLDITGSLGVSGSTIFRTFGGDEGGEIEFGIPQTNTTLSTRVVADVWQNRFRIFDGNTKGVHIDLSKAPTGVGGELIWKVSGIINTGSFVQLDNVKAGPTRNGAGGSLAGLSIGAVATTFVADLSATYSNSSSGGSTATGVTYNTTAANSAFGWGFGQGNQSTYILNDTTNSRVYRITLMIGASYNNNFISIERLF